MRAKQFLRPLFVFVLLVGFTYTAIAGSPEPPPQESEADSPEVSQVKINGFNLREGYEALPLSYAPNGQNFLHETEPNNTFSDATPLNSADVVAYGNIYPTADLDFYSFSGNAGDRVYAAVMTSFSANVSTDSRIQLLSTDGVTILEEDDDDGSLGGLSSTIAGTVLPSSGTFYLRVSHDASNQLRPYHLHVRIQSGTPTPETEPNDSGQALPVSQWVTGTLSSLTDLDIYTLTLNAGDTVYLSLDLDPERNTVEWNGSVGLGLFNGVFLIVNDSGTSTPDSEAFFMTVKDSGTYAALVSVPTGGTTFGTYHLSVSVHPAEAQVCTTYTSTDTPIAITDVGITTSSITIPGNPRIGDLNLWLDLTHTNMPDLDVSLISPQNNHNGVFSDIGSSTQTVMNLGVDDEAGIPFGLYTVVSGMVFQPELVYRLDWFDGEDAGGTWTLEIRDDTTANTGTLNSWSITLCDPEPPPVCPPGTVETVVFSSDFEASDGGFTHSGTADEWEWGLPAFVPITTCNSGTNCWKTDLDNTYNASSSQDLLSPSINLSGYSDLAWISWSQRYHIESASFDHAVVSVQQAGGANPRTLWEWLGATMNNTIGNPSTTINESAGWGQYTADISDYLGQNVELKFHLDSDSTVQLTGWAIDDVAVMACAPIPEISLAKTVGTDPGTCATTDTIAVAPGTDVTYCYEITNTGPITLTQHTLVDSELGTLLNNFPYSLSPGASAFLTTTVNITSTTVNSATWTAFNPGPINIATATDVATVTVTTPPSIVLTKTVGTTPGLCATTDVITVTYGTNVTYCYTVENTGGTTLNMHTLTDSALGPLFSNLSYPLGPGEVVSYTTSTPLYVTTVNTATWEAFNPGGYSFSAVPFTWVEIMTTGTPLGLSDDGEANVTMPFQFTFYGVTSDQVRIGNNGGVRFATTTGDVAVTNAALPNTAHPLTFFPFWDDIDADTGNVYYETQGTAPNRQFIVEWFDRPHFSNSPGHVTFQMILFEGTNEILFNYLDVDFSDPQWNFGASATIGVNESGTSATQYSFNTPSVTDNSSILFSPSSPAYAAASDTATVYVSLPATIEVSPESLTSTQAANTTIVQTLTISNTGEEDLNWSIGEEAPVSLPTRPSFQPTGPAGNPADAAETISTAGPGPSTPLFAPAFLSNFEVPAGVLYDNGPLVTHPGGGSGGADASAVQTALGMSVYGFGHSTTTGFRVADDFTVPAGGWTLNQVLFYAYQTGSSTTSTITTVNLRIWDGPPNAGGNVIWGDTTTNVMSATTWSNIYRVLDTDLLNVQRPVMVNTVEVGGLFLPAGTYWLDWQTGGTLASGPWAPPVTILGSTGTGNALQFDGAAWNPLVDTGAGTPQDLPFQLIGIGEPPACTTLGDIPWVSTNPITGTTSGGTSTTVQVTFDSTGLSAGVYTGTLCITSNDPVNSLVTIPLTLTVEAATYGVDLSGDDAASGAPGTTVSYVVTITNTGTTTDTFDLTSASTWPTTLSTLTITLGAGESTTFMVDVDVPTNALAGETDVATITATSQGDGTSTDTTLLTTAAEAVYGVTLSAAQASSGAPGDTVTYIITITNTGNITDTFDLTATGVWTATLSDASVTLAAGDSITFTVEVTIDPGAGDGASDVTTITATSQNEASATDSTTLTTTAIVPPEEGYSIYLPLIAKATP
ncbi:MAG: hypothetical protein Fur0022_32970 [Anaerolineales bacterium]